MRYFLDISYVGTRFAGWQVQNNNQDVTTVQQMVNQALSTMLRVPIECLASGRTDTGVHATHQVVHFDIEKEQDLSRWIIRLNSLLPNDVVANWVRPVKQEANARFDAFSRTYHYKVSAVRNPFLVERVLLVFKPLDLEKMNQAAQILFKHADFESFSKVHTDVNHFNCTITEAHWQQEDDLLIFTISANRFLRGMVRTIVGTLIDVGSGKTSLVQFEQIILDRNRKKAGHAVAPYGLYLAKVEYPEEVFR